MSLPSRHVSYSVEEYLALEREAEERHEYLDGQIYAMAGESPEHGAICMNLSRIVSTQLLGKDCQAFSKDMKVRSGPIPKPGQTMKGLFSYPHLLVVCGELGFHDEYRDVLLNPVVVIEVLSPTTEAETSSGSLSPPGGWWMALRFSEQAGRESPSRLHWLHLATDRSLRPRCFPN